MNFSNRDILTALYYAITILGIILIFFSWYVWTQSKVAPEPFSYWIAALVLLIMGIALVMFGIETYLFRDDPDVWL